jgi:hypothetical protein
LTVPASSRYRKAPATRSKFLLPLHSFQASGIRGGSLGVVRPGDSSDARCQVMVGGHRGSQPGSLQYFTN